MIVSAAKRFRMQMYASELLFIDDFFIIIGTVIIKYITGGIISW